MKEATLHDVATLAGVSTGTVSKYINGKKVGPKNSGKIKAAIEVLDYTPSPLARNFAVGRTYMISLIILAEYPIVDSTWLHELPIIHGINQALMGTPYSLKIEIASAKDDEENIRRIDDYSRTKYTDGIVLLSPWDISDKLLVPLNYRAFPYVVVGGGQFPLPSGSIDFDNRQPVCEITRDMAALGHRRIALIGGFCEQRHMKKREAGYRDALEGLGIAVDERLIVYGDFSLQSGYERAAQLLKMKDAPSAIVCGNDYIASGAIRAAKEMGLAVPEDVAVSGFDNTVVSDATDPAITSVRVPSFEMGLLAMGELLKRLGDKDYVIKNRVVNCEVIRKRSTSPGRA